MLSIIGGFLFIFLARCIDVSMATVRTIMVVKGKKLQAALIGFVEIIVYLLAINKVLSNIGDIGNLLSYASGFAMGNYLGIILEEKIAIGILIAQIVTTKNIDEFSEHLREKGFGVTVMEGYGKEGKIHMLRVVLDRKIIQKFEHAIEEYDDEAFITISDARNIKGGYFDSKRVKHK